VIEVQLVSDFISNLFHRSVSQRFFHDLDHEWYVDLSHLVPVVFSKSVLTAVVVTEGVQVSHPIVLKAVYVAVVQRPYHALKSQIQLTSS
jgi:hypothetical protein